MSIHERYDYLMPAQFAERLVMFADHCEERCRSLDIDVPPVAQDIRQASNDDLMNVQITQTMTTIQVEHFFNKLNEEFLDYCIAAFATKKFISPLLDDIDQL